VVEVPRENLGEVLRAARRKGFVGRGAERELFERAVAAAETQARSFTVLYVHGPGGIGKSALLRIFAELAREAHAVVVWVDGREVQSDRDAVQRRLASTRSSSDRTVLLIDTYELMGSLDGWLREELIPGLPSDSLVVLAGRQRAAGSTIQVGENCARY